MLLGLSLKKKKKIFLVVFTPPTNRSPPVFKSQKTSTQASDTSSAPRQHHQPLQLTTSTPSSPDATSSFVPLARLIPENSPAPARPCLGCLNSCRKKKDSTLLEFSFLRGSLYTMRYEQPHRRPIEGGKSRGKKFP